MKTGTIKQTATLNYYAAIIDVYNGEEQVLNSRFFNTIAGAKRWIQKEVTKCQ